MARFRTRARAVDMLGRQQIASLSTALSELFKNSHDAYATWARADFIRVKNMLIISDNGVGMDRHAFEEAWLTIATDRKLDRAYDSRPTGMASRTQLGQKGIGRLAIGALGSQVIAISKAQGSSGIAALVNWRMFELPHIDLAEVPIGLIELDADILDQWHIEKLREPLIEAVDRFRQSRESEEWNKMLETIGAELKAIPNDLDLASFETNVLRSGGTQFLVMPVSEDLYAELDTQTRDESLLTRTLHGFTDAWLGRASTPDFEITFVDHRPGGDVESLLNTEDFFDHSDFDHADHHIVGTFDETGRFVGRIRIFESDPMSVDIKRPMRTKPICGSFRFELGVVQGEASESRLDPEAFALMTARLKRLGGLYVYMDGVRVQPYGRPDVDYLEIEERRTRGAAYYYFSYRRMFGAVSLNSQSNARLEEKAGREGFTQGRAFAEFQRLLINLFEKLAATYFRPRAPQVYDYEKGRERLKAETKLRRERDRRAAQGRRDISAQLANAIHFLDRTDFSLQVAEIIRILGESLEVVAKLQEASQRVTIARRSLEGLLYPLRVDEPEGFALTEPMKRDLATVEKALTSVDDTYIKPALDTINRLTRRVEARLAAAETDVHERARYIEASVAGARKEIRSGDRMAREALTTVDGAVEAQLRDLIDKFEEGLNRIGVPSLEGSKGWIYEIDMFDRELNALTQAVREEILQLTNRIRTTELIVVEGAPTVSELAAAADAEILELRSRADDQLELVQLGMALSVIDHEFQSSVSSIRRDIRRVASWAKLNPQMRKLYNDLRRDFDHLDSYLTLLTPMQRRLRRAQTSIRGTDIYRFLRDLFADRLKASSVRISPSKEFQAVDIRGFTSTFYPVFINLVDNSLYWFKHSVSEAVRVIELDASDGSLIYRDNGPGIGADIVQRVFDFGFTTRPGGRGLGLAIARQVLDRAGWTIALTDYENGVEFRMSRKRGR